MKVGLGPDDIVLDGDLAPHTERGTATIPPLFGPCLLWPNCRPFQQTTELLYITLIDIGSVALTYMHAADTVNCSASEQCMKLFTCHLRSN